jgi:PAS domain S-box-containing protein
MRACLLGVAGVGGLALLVVLLGRRLLDWRSLERRYRAVLGAATDGFLFLDAEQRVVEANAAAAAIFGLPATALVGRSLTGLFAPDSTDQVRALFAHGPAEVGLTFAARAVQPTGEQVEVELRGAPLGPDASAPLLGIITNVTERQRAIERQTALSRKVLVAHEQERACLSRELHDGLGQLLAAIRLEMGWLRKRAQVQASLDVGTFEEATQLVERAADETRRVVRGLRPPLLDDLGLAAAVQHLMTDFNSRGDLKAELSLDIPDTRAAVPDDLALCAYRLLQESLTNVLRHARAANVRVLLRAAACELELEVIDDGVGFAADSIGERECCGLDGMSERAKHVRGSVVVTSKPGAGTHVLFRAPLAKKGGVA